MLVAGLVGLVVICYVLQSILPLTLSMVTMTEKGGKIKGSTEKKFYLFLNVFH